eukprot:UN0229
MTSEDGSLRSHLKTWKQLSLLEPPERLRLCALKGLREVHRLHDLEHVSTLLQELRPQVADNGDVSLGPVLYCLAVDPRDLGLLFLLRLLLRNKECRHA